MDNTALYNLIYQQKCCDTENAVMIFSFFYEHCLEHLQFPREAYVWLAQLHSGGEQEVETEKYFSCDKETRDRRQCGG